MEEGPRKARLVAPGVTGRDLREAGKKPSHRVRVGQSYVSIPRIILGGMRPGGKVAMVTEVRGNMVRLREESRGLVFTIYLAVLRAGWRRK